jgi:hypothetical protein
MYARRSRAVPVLLAALLAASCGGSADLLPDLDQAAPQAVSLREAGPRTLLAFASAVDNVGAGPLLLEGRRETRAAATMAVRQIVRRTDGSERAVPVGGVLRYARSETHRHWHLLDFERYELRDARTGSLVRPGRKTGFCLGDRYEASRSVELPGEPPAPVLTGECGRGGSGLLGLEEGISVGFGDDYVPLLEGQSLDVTGLPPGLYVLVHRANPRRILLEASYANNAASVLIELRPADGAVRVLASCPGSARCGNPGQTAGVEAEDEGGG